MQNFVGTEKGYYGKFESGLYLLWSDSKKRSQQKKPGITSRKVKLDNMRERILKAACCSMLVQLRPFKY